MRRGDVHRVFKGHSKSTPAAWTPKKWPCGKFRLMSGVTDRYVPDCENKDSNPPFAVLNNARLWALALEEMLL